MGQMVPLVKQLLPGCPGTVMTLTVRRSLRNMGLKLRTETAAAQKRRRLRSRGQRPGPLPRFGKESRNGRETEVPDLYFSRQSDEETETAAELGERQAWRPWLIASTSSTGCGFSPKALSQPCSGSGLRVPNEAAAGRLCEPVSLHSAWALGGILRL